MSSGNPPDHEEDWGLLPADLLDLAESYWGGDPELPYNEELLGADWLGALVEFSPNLNLTIELGMGLKSQDPELSRLGMPGCVHSGLGCVVAVLLEETRRGRRYNLVDVMWSDGVMSREHPGDLHRLPGA